jgi:hypothetical protein
VPERAHPFSFPAFSLAKTRKNPTLQFDWHGVLTYVFDSNGEGHARE